MEMYHAGFRIAVGLVRLVLDSGFTFKKDGNGDEYDAAGHVNVIDGQVGAVIWSANSRCLAEIEMQTSFAPVVSENVEGV